jgi:nuclear migration protein JNM1
LHHFIAPICLLTGRSDRIRALFAYPPSPTSSTFSGLPTRRVPLSQRFRTLQAEISALELELADPTDYQLHRETEAGEVDPGEMLRGIAEVRSRLERVRHGREGRGRLVNLLALNSSDPVTLQPRPEERKDTSARADLEQSPTNVEIDRRVGVLEKIIGSSRIALDESSPLPSALLPLLSRLNGQMVLLTQPRHIDSVSRRLKLLLSDLDRISNHVQNHRKQTSHSHTNPEPRPGLERVVPVLSRLGPSLPQIPHILTRLRTLSVLHASAAEFQSAIAHMEEEQRKLHQVILQLEDVMRSVEGSIQANKTVTARNVEGLESRIKGLMERMGG